MNAALEYLSSDTDGLVTLIALLVLLPLGILIAWLIERWRRRR